MPDFRSSFSSASRGDILTTAHGLVSWTGNPNLFRSTAIPTANAASGSLVLTELPLRSGDIVSNLVTNITVVGTGLTFAKLALYNSTGGFIRATASVSATFNSGTGYKVVPLTAAYSVTADGSYYVGYLQYGSGATGATFNIGVTAATLGTTLNGIRPFAIVTNQTDLAADVTLADAGSAYFFAVS